MKLRILYVLILVFGLSSCDKWLTLENPNELSDVQAYSSVTSISSIASNLYSRVRLDQDFRTMGDGIDGIRECLYDYCRWDDAICNGYYWQFSTNVGVGYRATYDYNLIRDINIHINNLKNKATSLTEEQRSYLIAEGRFLRAFVYFTMVRNLGGVPIVEEVYEYTTNPIEYAKPRDTEAAVYEYISSEMDAIKDDLSKANISLTRATKGAALALKSRAMLYAGTLAFNHDKSQSMQLNLPSGATGIPYENAKEYLTKCIDAYKELETLNTYDLYKNSSASLSENFYNIFVTKDGNPELIFIRDYDGSNDFPNNFTSWALPRSLTTVANISAQINPTLNFVESFRKIGVNNVTPLDAYEGDEPIVPESMEAIETNYNYVKYDSPSDIFKDRDPRLQGTVILPGESFRGTKINLQAGLAIPKSGGGYSLKMLDMVENVESASNFYNGEQITSIDGPFRNSYYTSHSGFLLRKYVDQNNGSEASGKSSVPYIIFRYSEILLNAGEAAYYLSQMGETTYKEENTMELSLKCINEVRERAGGASFKLALKDLTLDEIRNERRAEFAFEDHRYYDMKRWRIADEIWDGQWNSTTSRMTGLWPYKIYAPGTEDNGKWIFRRVYIEHRGDDINKGLPIKFSRDMYYSLYPQTEGNPYIEKNPLH